MSDGLDVVWQRSHFERICGEEKTRLIFKGRGKMCTGEIISRMYVPHMFLITILRSDEFKWTGIIHCSYQVESAWSILDGKVNGSPAILYLDRVYKRSAWWLYRKGERKGGPFYIDDGGAAALDALERAKEGKKDPRNP